ncbi:MAG: hypothetical protein SFV24_17830 [Gemmatimonadales bacterium]|jgi:hypothetical protein|nr:hypothetical protein [Gemmatimonadales bacterium]
MTTFDHYASDSLSSLIAGIDRYPEAGIDPDFDGDPEELERQFAELRLTFDRN